MSENKKSPDSIYQERCRMTRDERAIDARDNVAKSLYEQNLKDGKRSTYEECQRKMSKIAEIAEKQRKE